MMALTVASFFIHSLMPPEVSREEIDGAAGVVGSVIPESSGTGSFIISNLSAIAHLFEYGLLGAQCALYVFIFVGKRRAATLLSFGLVHMIALLDETLQIFSGRVSDVADIWLDIIGYALAFAAVTAVALLIRGIKNKEKKNG